MTNRARARLWFLGAIAGAAALGSLRAAAAEPGSFMRASALAREGVAARAAGDSDTAVAKSTEAAELRPEYPDFHFERVLALTAAGRPDEAVDALRRIARLGLHPAGSPGAWPAALKAHRGFPEVAKLLAANLQPRGSGEVAFALRGVTGVIEAMAVRNGPDDVLLGDAYLQTVWVRTKDGDLRRFSEENASLLGVMALAADRRRGVVWAATAAVPEMPDGGGADAGKSALVELDAADGKVLRVWSLVPESGEAHELRGVALGADGAVWLADRAGRALWRLPPGGARLERVAQAADWLAPRGVVALADGTVVLGDEKTGLHRVDPGTGTVTALALPETGSLSGLTGLCGDGGNSVYVLQGDVRPARVVRVVLAADGAAVGQLVVLESGHLSMGAPAGACLTGDGELLWVGNAGWGRVTGGPSGPRPVAVLRAKIGIRTR